LRIVLRNLLENAWKFTAMRAHAHVELGVLQEDADEKVFYVRDNGCGFDMECAEHLFQRFCRLHGQGTFAGSGSGLVTVRRVLQRHGGRIWVDSVKDQGSTFHFCLPARARRAPRAPDASRG